MMYLKVLDVCEDKSIEERVKRAVAEAKAKKSALDIYRAFSIVADAYDRSRINTTEFIRLRDMCETEFSELFGG